MHNPAKNDTKFLERRVFVSVEFMCATFVQINAAMKAPLKLLREEQRCRLHSCGNMTTCPLGAAELLRVDDKAEVFRWLYTVRNRWSQRLCLPLSLSFDMQIESSQRMTDAVVWLSRTTGLSKHTDLSGRKKGSDTTRHRIDSPT